MNKKTNKTVNSKNGNSKTEKSMSKDEVVDIINKSINQNNSILLQQIQNIFGSQKSSIVETKNEVEQKEEDEYERSNIDYDGEKLIGVQNMSIGAASYFDGKSSIYFTEPFAVRKMRWSLLRDFIDHSRNRDTFENGNLVILDENVRIIEGLQEAYKEKGATEKDFRDMLKLKAEDLISKLNTLQNPSLTHSLIRANDLRVVFLIFFLKEYNKGNPDAVSPEKFTKLDNYYKKEFNYDPIASIALSMKEGHEVWKM